MRSFAWAAIALVLLAGLSCATGGGLWLDDAELAPLVERTVQVRGLAPKRPLRVQIVEPDQVREQMARELDLMVTPELLASDQRLKRALGLLPAGVDLREALLALQADTVVGFYSPLDRSLHLVSERFATGDARRLGPRAESVVIHEIAHALQDQHTGLLDVAMGLVDHDDLAFALAALLEGDAAWTAFQDESRIADLPPPAPEDYAREMAALGSELFRLGAPRLLRDVFLMAYPSGYALVERLVEGGGVAALDAALFDPPLSSQEVLHPERYLGERRPLAMPVLDSTRFAPDPACRVEAGNTFGELGLRVWAAEVGAPAERAAEAAEGWRADRAVLLACPGGSAFAWLLHFEDLTGATGFLVRTRGLRWQGHLPNVLDEPRVDAAGARVLLSAGLSQEGRRWLLHEAPLVGFRDLTDYLTARPAVLKRARSLRDAELP